MLESEKLKIVFAASEAVPYAKTGGLGDVVGALSAALVKRGVSVSVFLPLYAKIDRDRYLLRSTGKDISVPISDRNEQGYLWMSVHEGVNYFFIEHEHYFNRPGFYGSDEGDYPDNAERFLFFSRGVLEAAKILGLKPDVVHCHDWHTGLIPLYLKKAYADDFPNAASVFTIHNLGYQGIFERHDWHLLNLPLDYFNNQTLEFFGKINYLKGGLYASDLLTTVSFRYAKEIQTPAYGCRLEGVLKERKKDLFGVLNGIDTKTWNPAHDPYIATQFKSSDLAGKDSCKAALQKEFGLPFKKEIPLLAMITRLVEHKGIDLVVPIIKNLMKQGVQLVFLGSGEKKYETLLKEYSEQFPDKIGVKIAYDAALAHRIEAGADMFLMPSHYEPCGLSQMMSLQYGTVPIVRATGGLDDTVRPFNRETEKGNGFKFKAYTVTAFLRQINNALSLYNHKKTKWQVLMKNGMQGDYSWGVSAITYIQLYQKLQRKKEGA